MAGNPVMGRVCRIRECGSETKLILGRAPFFGSKGYIYGTGRKCN
jgi:hypothetical protein